MTSGSDTPIFLCSFCEQAIEFRQEQEGRRIQCPKCRKNVWLYGNTGILIGGKLTSSWFYKRPKLFGLLGSSLVGPIQDTEFLELIHRGEIGLEMDVQSPELTRGKDVPAGKVNLNLVRDMCSQRNAEEQRLRNVQARERQRDARNRETLLQGVRTAIADGSLSLKERHQLLAFAAKAGISDSEVEDLLRLESLTLLGQVVDDAVSDGFFDDSENEKLSKIAIGLGLSLQFTRDQEFRLSLARAAWELLKALQANTLPQTLEFDGAEVFEIVVLKRPSGISLGNDHYLKSIGVGVVKRVDKSFLLDGRLIARKFALSSIANVQWFSDGLFIKRSTGKSLFIRPTKLGFDWYRFAITMEVLSKGEPVLGILPEDSFIPAADILASELVDDSVGDNDCSSEFESSPDSWEPASRIPRFTFRIVGESYENRQHELNRISIGDEVLLVREPGNPYDYNAVAVFNREKKQLGYLKREVSLWFAPILDRGRRFQCEVKHRTSSGGILISVFE